MNNQKQQNQENKLKKKKKYKLNRNAILVIQVLVVLFLMGMTVVGGAVIGFIGAIVKDQKVLSYEEMKNKIETNYLTGFAYFNDGTLIGKLPAEQDRRLVTLEEISPHVIDALISTEDKDFWDHKGVSPKATFRAVWQQITGADFQTGGSTLTQQLVKQTLLEEAFAKELSGEYKGEELRKLKYIRKLNEIFLALRLERFFTKEQILTAYLNEMYFGMNANRSNLYGIQAAAKGIFGVDAKDLNIAQSAYLVGMLQNPGHFIPFKHIKPNGLEKGLERMKLVLGEMYEDGKITKEEYEEALHYDIEAHLASKEETKGALDKYPYLLFEILDKTADALVEADLMNQGFDLQEIHSEENRDLYEELHAKKIKEIQSRGYNIYTTIDQKLYDAFQAYVANPDNFWKNKSYKVKIGDQEINVENAMQQVGAVLMDNRTGAILANIAGRDFNVEQTNHATSPRQPGSTMKPILAYGPALEEGVLLSPESPVDDSPIVLNYGKPNEHTPMNYTDKFLGIMTAREALRQSWNIPAIRVYLDLTIPVAFDYAKRMGITSLVDQDLHAQTGVIGGLTHGVSVEEMTNAFSTFANGGKFIDAYMIERVEDPDGNVIYQHKPKQTPVFSEQTAYMVTDMMRTVYNQGTGSKIRQLIERQHGKHDFAGKTGTTSQEKDLWFVGYSPNITLGVWTGFDIPYPMSKDASRAKLVWAGLMNLVLDLKPELSPKDLKFTKPDGLVTIEICSKSGMLPSDLCREAGHVIKGTFKKESVPTETCDIHQKSRAVIIDEKTYIAQESTPDDMVISKIFIKRDPIQLPTKKTNKPLSAFLPADWMDTLPTEVDPRQEDGKSPSPPQGLSATYDGNSKQITLKWNPNPEGDIAGYRIYRSNGFDFENIASILNHQPKQYVDANGGPEAGYYITAVDIAGNESMASNVVSASGGKDWSTSLPSKPTGVKAVKGAVGIELSWEENPSDEKVEQYNIYYSPTKDGEYELIGSNSIPFFQHLIYGEEIGWYKVTAVNHRGESEPSKAFTIKENGGNDEDQRGNDRDQDRDHGDRDSQDSNLIDIPIPPSGGNGGQ
jgi:penicillin-binding protein